MDDLVRGHAAVHVYLQAVRIKDDLAAAGDQDVDQVFQGHGVRLGVFQGFVFGFRLLDILLRARYVFRRLGLVQRRVLWGLGGILDIIQTRYIFRRLDVFRGLHILAKLRGDIPLRGQGRRYPLKR
jgi:hypothetical protein